MEVKDIKATKKYRVIMSGGGTGGHFYPAVAIADELKRRYKDDIDILFVGAYGKMEMDKIPSLGWDIIGLHIAGLQRRLTLKNLQIPFKVIDSYIKSTKIVNRFKPNIVIGTGGYVTLPILSAAARNGVPTMIWEGNSYSGMANKVLGKKAKKIFVSYEGMDKFYEKDKIVISGNPLRGELIASQQKREEGYEYFGIDKSKPTLFITGGSLGTSILNNALLNYFDKLIADNEINIIWQSGSAHDANIQSKIEGRKPNNFWVKPFVDRMDLAYNVADVVIARSGASTLSELALIGRASILVPSSNVPDNHQTKNALSFVEKNAACIITDEEAKEKLVPLALKILRDKERIEELEQNVKKFAEPKSVIKIVDEIVCYLK